MSPDIMAKSDLGSKDLLVSIARLIVKNSSQVKVSESYIRNCTAAPEEPIASPKSYSSGADASVAPPSVKSHTSTEVATTRWF